MPRRRYPIVKDEIYHVFNRGIAKQPIFLEKRDYARALQVINFYAYFKPKLRFSYFNRLPLDQRHEFLNDLKMKGKKQVEIFVFCLMPNHFHFLLKQKEEDGIANFVRNFQNSYAKYFNMRYGRTGSLFESMFKAVRIESDEQFLHVARYVHLNPLTSYLIKDADGLDFYLWSSFKDYLGNVESNLIRKDFLLKFFSSAVEFKNFTLDQMDYQRELDTIKHLVLE